MDKGKEICYLFWKKSTGLVTSDPEASSSSSQQSPQACQCPGIFPPPALKDPDHQWTMQLSAAGPSLGTWMPLTLLQEQGRGEGQTARKATGQGGKGSAGTEAWQAEGFFSPWSGLDCTAAELSCKD